MLCVKPEKGIWIISAESYKTPLQPASNESQTQPATQPGPLEIVSGRCKARSAKVHASEKVVLADLLARAPVQLQV